MEAIVLAGGFGTRLKEVVSDVPKPMAPVNGKPFLYYILSYLKHHHVTRVILSVGYKWTVIKDYFGDSFDDIELIYSIEDSPLGTGGAIQQALTYVQNSDCFVLNGDTFFNVDLSNLTLDKNSQLLLCLKEMKNFERYGCVEIDSKGFVVNFKEKQRVDRGLINGGVYLLSKSIFDSFDLGSSFSFESFMELNFRSLGVSSRVSNHYFIDIGIPSDYLKVDYNLMTY